MTRYRLEKLQAVGKLPAKPLVIKTQVTTELITAITTAFGGVVNGDLLVGFKYIGNILGELEAHGRFGDVTASLDDFVLGTEESHGLLLTPHIRDKDAAGAAVVLAEMASDLASEGRTIYDYLIETYKRYGYFRNYLRSTIMAGAAGTAAIQKIQAELRANPPTEIGGRKVEQVVDYFDEERFGPFVSNTDRAGRNLMTYFLEGGLKATIRPSGTEPKNKIYLEMPSEPLGPCASDAEFLAQKALVDAGVVEFSNAFLETMLEIVGISLPAFCLEVSDLVSLENKMHFGKEFAPRLLEKARMVDSGSATEESVQQWIDDSLKSYGSDARLLVSRAFDAFVAQQADEPGVATAVRVFRAQ